MKAPGADQEAVATICERLDGLPLAIELAAARTALLAPLALLRRLDRRLELLTAGARDADERHQTLQATIDWSLEPEVRAVRDSAALDLIEAEHDNLRAATDWSAAAGRTELTLRLTGALWPFWLVRGHWTEALPRLDAALSAAPLAGLARAKPLLGRALFLVWVGQPTEAEADGRELLALAEDAGDAALKAHAIDRLALAAQSRGDYANASAMHRQIVALSRETDDPPLLCIALGNLADISLNEGNFEQSAALSEEALQIARNIGNVERVASALDNLGSALLGLGRTIEAAERFADSLRCSAQIGSTATVGYALDGLGAVAAALGYREHAARLLGAANGAFQALDTTLQTFETRRHEDVLAQLRTELGADGLAVALADGQAMTPAQAAALLLSDIPATVTAG